MEAKLPHFEGRKVEESALRLTGKADGQVGSLAVEEEVFLLVRASCSAVSHQDVTVGGATLFTRVHKLAATRLVLLPPADGQRMMDKGLMLADERFGLQGLFANPDIGEITGGIGE